LSVVSESAVHLLG